MLSNLKKRYTGLDANMVAPNIAVKIAVQDIANIIAEKINYTYISIVKFPSPSTYLNGTKDKFTS